MKNTTVASGDHVKTFKVFKPGQIFATVDRYKEAGYKVKRFDVKGREGKLFEIYILEKNGHEIELHFDISELFSLH